MKILRTIKEKIIYVIPAVFYIVPFLLKLVYYPISDDYLLTFVVRGAYDNKPNSHLLVINETLTSIWEKLYKLLPNFEWYAITIVLLVLFNSYIIFFILKKRFNKYMALFIVIIIEIFMLAWISFTVIAYYTAFTLGAFVFYSLKNDVKWYKALIITGILVFGGFCFRDKAFVSGFAAAFPIIIFSIEKANIKKAIISGATIGLLVLIFVGINQSVYSQKELNSVLDWGVARAQVEDYPISEYEDNRTLYNKIGFSENDYFGLMIKGSYMADLQTYSTSNLKEIVKETPFDVRYNTSLKSILVGLAKVKELWAFLIIIGVMLWLRKTKKQLLFSITEILLVLGQCIYLFFIGRPGDRIIIPLFFFSVLEVLLFTLYEKNNINKKIKLACIVVPLLLVVLYSIQIFNFRNFQLDRQEKYTEVEQYIMNDQDNLYTVNCHHKVLMNKPIQLFRKPKMYNNILDLSNYEVLFSNVYYNKVKEFNLTYKDNLLVDIAKDDNVLFIDLDGEYIDRIETYIKEHTGKSIEKETIKSFKKSNTKIYKIGFK